jgi:hypothetical protein
MPDEPRLPPTDSTRGAESSQIVGVGNVTMKKMRVSGYGTIRDAVQELHDASLEDLRRLLAEYDRATAPTGMPSLAKLIRAGAKFGIVTIIAAIIGAPVTYEESNLLHWTPPSITVVQQMSPTQMDELAHQIERHLEQVARREEVKEKAKRERHHHHGHR